jgi:hypothetical protein
MSDRTRWHQDYAGRSVPLPPQIDVNVPSIARGYDYVLGGKNHFEADRAATAALLAVVPLMPALAEANRAFLRRGVRYLVGEAGIRQLIDIGSGLPTLGNVHEIAHAIEPNVHVVYVDIDPIVLAHGRALLADGATTTVVHGDAGAPASIFDNPATRELIDFEQPVGVLLSGILHHLPDERDPVKVTRIIKERIPSGSYVLISNFLDDDDPHAKQAEKALTEGFGTGRFRTWEEQHPYLEGLQLVPPGFVYANEWRPDTEWPRGLVSNAERIAATTFYAAGIGRKP